MRIQRRESWKSAIGLGLLLPVVAFSTSFPFESRIADLGSDLSPAPTPGSVAALAVAPAEAVFPPAEAVSPPAEAVFPPATNAGPRVALQAGHWLSAEVPDELRRLRFNGTTGGGKAEWEVTLEIARRAAGVLEERGYLVEILPTTIPPRYVADLFVSIHADGFNDPAVSGFTIAAPRRDPTGRASEFVEVLAEKYAAATNLRRRANATRRMQNYYAFNSRRYDHALDPSTVAVILETGFLTSPSDRRVIVDAQDLPALGIAEAIMHFLPFAQAEPLPFASSSR